MKSVTRWVCCLSRVGFWAVAAAGCAALMLFSLPESSTAGVGPGGVAQPPVCPPGWVDFSRAGTGLRAFVPPGFRVKTTAGMLTVKRVGQPLASAYLVPLKPVQRATAAQLGQAFAQFVQQLEPSTRWQFASQESPQKATVAYTMTYSGQPIEGRFNVAVSDDGKSACIIGVSAGQGRLATEWPVLTTIAKSFGAGGTPMKWVLFRSPQNSMTLQVPQGWTVETTEGMIAKNEVDWWAYNPQNPTARAFSTTPKYCTPQIGQSQPLHAPANGYKYTVFQNPQDCVQATLSQLPLQMQVRVTAMTPNQPLTQLFNQMIAPAAQFIRGLAAGDLRCFVYDCEAVGQAGATQIRFSFGTAIAQLSYTMGIMGQGTEQWVWCRGWFAPTDQAVLIGPILDRIQGSFEYTPQYMAAVFKAQGERAKFMRDTYRSMAKIDREIVANRWKTNEGIARMNYDLLTGQGGHVNPKTGEVEGGDCVNSRGETVSKKDVDAGMDPDQATVLNPAQADDYIKDAGSHGGF